MDICGKMFYIRDSCDKRMKQGCGEDEKSNKMEYLNHWSFIWSSCVDFMWKRCTINHKKSFTLIPIGLVVLKFILVKLVKVINR
jgi:hypothetical protein